MAGLCAGALFGQNEEDVTGETMVLDPFNVSGSQVGRYQSTDATSGGRVRVDVFEAMQSISVVPRDLMNDIAVTRVLEAAKYVSGITESILPGGLDRTTVRGFQIDGTTVDGFASGNQQGNLDPILIERVEVVKGPNAVLSPTGQPGGTINLVSRKPQFSNFGSISYQVGRYNGDRAELDINRVFGAEKNWAFRVVGAYQDTILYPHVPLETQTWMPMFTWKSKTGAQFTAQFEWWQFWDQNYLGYPVDPSSGSTNDAKLLTIVPRDTNVSGNDFRADQRKEVRLFLTAPLTDSIDMRLVTRLADTSVSFAQNIPGPAVGVATGGSFNPLTGLYTPGFTYSSVATGAVPTAIAVAYTPTVIGAAATGRNGNDQYTLGPVANLQNDYVHKFKNSFIDTTTVGGVALNYSKISTTVINNIRPALDVAHPELSTDYVRSTLANALNTKTTTTNINEQAYLQESVKLWDERIALNGSYSYNNFDVSVRNMVTVAPTTTVPVPQQRYTNNIDTSLKSYGILVKPIPSIALYYSHSEVASVNTPGTAAFAAGTGSSPALTLQSSEQEEYGIRFEGFKKRLFVTLCHFDIKQDGFSIPNPGNLVVPQPVPLLPNLIANRIARGWELEARLQVSKNFSVIGNATTFINRDQNYNQFRGTAEKSGALLASYQFNQESALGGLSVAVGVEYVGRRPGDAPGATPVLVTPPTGTPFFVTNQPSFYLAPHTLVNLMVGYKLNKNWNIQANVTNITDEDYIAAGVNRGNVIPGEPMNAKLKVTYSF